MSNVPQTRTEPGDKAIALYHVVYKHETFEHAAQVLFDLVKRAQEQWPGKRRALFLDIEGHRNRKGGFDHDMAELQTEFLTGFLMRYLSEAHIPLFEPEPAPTKDKPKRVKVQYLENPRQRNDVPDVMRIDPAGGNHEGEVLEEIIRLDDVAGAREPDRP